MKVKSLKKAAGVVEAYLESIGKPVKYVQALEVVALAHGAKNWNTLQASHTGRSPASIPELQNLKAIDTECKKCGSPMAHGYCTDNTCAYSDWPQSVAWGVLTNCSDAEIESSLGITKRQRVKAEVQDDAALTCVEFDAGPWFEQAADADIEQLREIGWRGDYPADEVALFFEETNQDVANLMYFCQGSQGTHTPIGFECEVEEDSAMAWLKRNRTQLWARFLCDENEVSLVEATEPEIAGMWDWLSRETGEACDRSFSTEGEAAMNAVLVLNLGKTPDTFAVKEVPSLASRLWAVYSPTEAAAQQGAGWWSNKEGWSSESDAALFTSAEQSKFNLPVSAGNDARWVPLSSGVSVESGMEWAETLSTGDEVWWNDPDCGKSSGYYLITNLLVDEDAPLAEDTVVELRNAAGSHAEVYVSELSPIRPSGLYPVVDGDTKNVWGFAFSMDEAIAVGEDAMLTAGTCSLALQVELVDGSVVEKAWVLSTSVEATTNDSEPIWLFNQGPVSPQVLNERYTDDTLTVIVDVPLNLMGDIEAFNDYVSERATGSIADLTDIGFEVYHLTDGDREKYGRPDGNTVLMLVSGAWTPDE